MGKLSSTAVDFFVAVSDYLYFQYSGSATAAKRVVLEIKPSVRCAEHSDANSFSKLSTELQYHSFVFLCIASFTSTWWWPNDVRLHHENDVQRSRTVVRCSTTMTLLSYYGFVFCVLAHSSFTST